MALVNCPECSKDVSEFAVSCPSCGYSVKEHYDKIRETKREKILTEVNNTLLTIKPVKYYTGYQQLAGIVAVILEKGSATYNLSKEIYPEASRRLDCHVSDLERNIRVMIPAINREKLESIRKQALPSKITTKTLINILATHIMSRRK